MWFGLLSQVIMEPFFFFWGGGAREGGAGGGVYKDFVPNPDWKSIAQQIRSRQGINYSVPLVSILFLIAKGLV